RQERPQNGAGSFQDGMPAVRLEHDARVEIAAVVDERWAVAAKSCARASPLAFRHRWRLRLGQRAATGIVRDKRGGFGRAGQFWKLFFGLNADIHVGWTN